MKIRPNKHSNPDLTVVSAAVIILDKLIKSRTESFDSIERYMLKKIPEGRHLLMPALDLLYLLGTIEYRSKTDSFEFVRNR